MRKHIAAFILFSIISAWLSPVLALNSFIVKDIQVQGLQRIRRSTVLNYLPVHRGQRLNLNKSSHIIGQLYGTGFFQDVSLLRRGQTLVVRVVERPTIRHITLQGNKQIRDKQLRAALKNLNIAPGTVFDSSVLDGVRRSLINQYVRLGYFNVDIQIIVVHKDLNRIDLSIQIDEGQSLRIKKIDIIGNQVFSERKLQRQLSLKRRTLLSFFSKADRYVEVQLLRDLETLRTFYMDRGYLAFKVLSHHAAITPDKRYVYININLHEGEQYRLSGLKLDGQLLGYGPAFERMLKKFKTDEVFSRAKIQAVTKAMGLELGKAGYVSARITPVPHIDEAKKTVFITFMVEPGQRNYVHRINFVGNIETQDVVLRRRIYQLEGAPVNIQNIQESERSLRMTSYFKTVNSKVLPAPGLSDQVDVTFNVDEIPTTKFSAALGYGTQYKLTGNVSINQSNVLGTGRMFGINANFDRFYKQLSVTYNNPFYTQQVSRGFTIFGRRLTPGRVGIAGYSTSEFGFSLDYGLHLTGDNMLHLGLGAQKNRLEIGRAIKQTCAASTLRKGGQLGDSIFGADSICDYLDVHDEQTHEVFLTAGWTHNGLDRALFPTKGLFQSATLKVALPISSQSLAYYKANYFAHLLQPIYHDFILTASGRIGYGNGYHGEKGLPFFRNFHAGGVGTVRGFAPNALGPKLWEATETTTQCDIGPVTATNFDGSVINPEKQVCYQSKAIGGDLLTVASIGLILPQYFTDSVRVSLFADAGNVFNLHSAFNPQAGAQRFDWHKMAYSVGVAVEWRSPIGPIVLSLAKGLNGGRGSDTEVFQYTGVSGS